MVKNLSRLCVHWRRRDAAIPPPDQRLGLRHRIRPHEATEDGTAIGCDIPRHQHRDLASGLQTIFPRSGMDSAGQVSGKPRDHHHHVIGGVGAHDFVLGGGYCHTVALC